CACRSARDTYSTSREVQGHALPFPVRVRYSLADRQLGHSSLEAPNGDRLTLDPRVRGRLLFLRPVPSACGAPGPLVRCGSGSLARLSMETALVLAAVVRGHGGCLRCHRRCCGGRAPGACPASRTVPVRINGGAHAHAVALPAPRAAARGHHPATGPP